MKYYEITKQSHNAISTIDIANTRKEAILLGKKVWDALSDEDKASSVIVVLSFDVDPSLEKNINATGIVVKKYKTKGAKHGRNT